MEILSAEHTRERLPYAQLADAIAGVLRTPGANAPERVQMALPGDGTLLLMPAADDTIAMTKMVTMHPHNVDAGLATIQGEMVVMDAANGERKGIVDGATVSGRRTAALSLLAARELAPVTSGPAVIVGAGVQARTHIEALAAGLGTDRFFICSRTRSRAEALARDVADELGVRVDVIDDIRQAPEHVRLFVTVTTSSTPVLPEHLPDDAFVAAVGAFKPDMAELPPALIAGGRVVVDTLDGAQSEAGDLIQAVAGGALDWDDARLLAEVIDDGVLGSGPVLFKSVGHSLWDLAAARLAFA